MRPLAGLGCRSRESLTSERLRATLMEVTGAGRARPTLQTGNANQCRLSDGLMFSASASANSFNNQLC